MLRFAQFGGAGGAGQGESLASIQVGDQFSQGISHGPDITGRTQDAAVGSHDLGRTADVAGDHG